MLRQLAVLAALASSVAAQPIKTEIVEAGGKYQLLRGGEPYFVNGAGGQSHLDVLVEAGGNSIRTWHIDDAERLLDEAHALGITVTMGIWLGHERHGFDYSDPQQVAAQRSMVERAVLDLKDHPALLMWGLGNEVALVGDPRKLFPHIESLAAMVQELDPNHPVMTVIAGAGEDKIRALAELCPSIDVVGVNEYGEASHVPGLLESSGYTGPYLLTEFGPRGWWESPETDWGAQIEETSAEKMASYRRNYESAVASQPGRCLGSYVFLWGQKQEATSTWFGMFLEDGSRTPVVDTMTRLWTGREPADPAPVVRSIICRIARREIGPGERFSASVDVFDPNGDELTVDWVIVAESTDRRMGGDAEAAPPSFPE
ncbi:MAG: glycoside hydrolase family 2 TIM barrel-domain containing protein, partial [Planctomycetota bacterium]